MEWSDKEKRSIRKEEGRYDGCIKLIVRGIVL